MTLTTLSEVLALLNAALKISAATVTTTLPQTASYPVALVGDTTARRITHATLRGGVFNVKDYGAVGNGTTDDYAAIVAAIVAATAAGGGVIYFPPARYLVSSKITLPNVPVGAGLAPNQFPITFQGVGGHASGQDISLGTGGSRLLLNYQGDGTPNDAKIVTYGCGLFALSNIVLQDTTAGPSSTPFIMTTNTTLKIDATVAFLGTTAAAACQQDAIILGGTLIGPFDDADAPFQGYGTTIVGAYFDRVRRVVYGRTYVNQVVIRDCFFNKNCGSNLAGGACIELDGSFASDLSPVAMNIIEGNYFELISYVYGVKLIHAAYNSICNNGFEDGQTGTICLAAIRMEDAQDNFIRDNFAQNHLGQNVTLSEDAGSLHQNPLSSPHALEGNWFNKPVRFYGRIETSLPLGAKATASTQSIPYATLTTVAFASESWDTDGIHDNVTNNSRLTCQTAGKYIVNARLMWGTQVNGRRFIDILLNGSLILESETGPNGGGEATSQATTIIDLAVGQYLQVQVYQSGAAGGLNILSTGSEFSMVRVL